VPQTRPYPGHGVGGGVQHRHQIVPPTDQISPPIDPAESAGREEQVHEQEQEPPPPPRPPELPHSFSGHDEYYEGH